MTLEGFNEFHKKVIPSPVILRKAEGEVAESAPATSPPQTSSAGAATSD